MRAAAKALPAGRYAVASSFPAPVASGWADVLLNIFSPFAREEFLRVLRPGGRLLVLEFSQIWKPLAPFYDFYSFRFMPWAGGVIAGDRESYRYLAESIRMHPDQPTFAGMMTDAGFERVSWKNMTFGICAMHIGFKPGA